MNTYRTAEVAAAIGIHPNTVRLYEKLSLIPKPEREANGYRISNAEDIKRLKVIRSMRCANYSLEAILRMLRQLSQNPDVDIKAALNTPNPSEDIISICDRLIVSLTAAECNATKIGGMLQEMKEKYENPPLCHQSLDWWYFFIRKMNDIEETEDNKRQLKILQPTRHFILEECRTIFFKRNWRIPPTRRRNPSSPRSSVSRISLFATRKQKPY